jgi:hypothetical protein
MQNLHKKHIQQTRTFTKSTVKENKKVDNKVMYEGEVVSIIDPSGQGGIRVRITPLDNNIPDDSNIPYSYPLLSRILCITPQKGEIVNVTIPDEKSPQIGRKWAGPIIPQLDDIDFASKHIVQRSNPKKNVDLYPEAKGVYPNPEDVGLLGRENTDILLKPREIVLRAGKHVVGNKLQLNIKNPATHTLLFEEVDDILNPTRSMQILLADKIALISHDGQPKYRAANLDKTDREKIIADAHPMVRGDVLVKILEIYRQAIVNHIHPYDKMQPDNSSGIPTLQEQDLETMLQKNLLIN